ncbi:hypothetical protein EI982_15780 [Haloplanus rallus]|jgi:hypothetical protein|uniref:Uncharacterized protein n=1 Tax=Haloplanus rallus TaxID=1816183 RepID=A0A6B9FHE3_9EURY|nr:MULTISPECIES: hypothetical protein [Haloplanus]QGX96133.1 hypothetical protein EI982_15780 [Haloplanus rallus]
MSTHQQSTTDRRTDPTLTDGRWTAGTPAASTPPRARTAQRQFDTGARYRLPNLVDDENRAMF